jgi:hypothetical protein
MRPEKPHDNKKPGLKSFLTQLAGHGKPWPEKEKIINPA